MDSIFFFFWFCWFCWWCLFAAEKMDYDQEGGGVVIIVLASLKGGNRTTAERIANHMKQIDGAIVELKDTNSALLTRESLSKDIQYYANNQNKKVLGVGLHALRSGRFLVDNNINFFMILGGTDVNCHSHQECYQEELNKVFTQALKIISFHPSQSHTFSSLWPPHILKLNVIPPAVLPPSLPSSPIPIPLPPCSSPQDRGGEGEEEGVKVLLLVAGVRDVKDPVFLMDIMSDLSGFMLVIVGEILDQEYHRNIFFPKIQKSKNVCFLPAVPQATLYSYMASSFAMINSSKSEGLSNSLLEAMYCRILVIARDIPGNSIVEERITGLTFHTPNDFKTQLEHIKNNKKLHNEITERAFLMVSTKFSAEHERKQYQQLVFDWIEKK